MLVAEYSYEEDIRVKQEEAKQEGLEHGFSQGLSQGLSQGIEQEKLDTVRRMLEIDVFDLDMIAQATGLTLEEVAQIKDNNNH